MERLNVFKKQKIKAVILLEAVISLAIFASIATLLLGQIQESRKREVELLKQEEVLRVARMALQTGQKQLTVNGLTVHVCLLYTSPSPRDRSVSRMPSSA